MKTITGSKILYILLLACSLSFAGENPISWRLTPASGFPATRVGHQSVVQYTLTNRLPFPTVVVTEHKSTGGKFSVHDECLNASLLPNASCDISIGFNPADETRSTFQLIIGYHNNRVPLPILTASGIGIPANTQLSSTLFGLPPTFYLNNQPDFSAIYTNVGATPLTGCVSGAMPFTLSGPASATAQVIDVMDECNAKDLAPHQSCEVQGRLTNTSTPGVITVTGNLSCRSGSKVVSARPSASSIVQNQSGCTVHGTAIIPLPQSTFQYSDNIVTFQFENECDMPVSLSAKNISVKGVSAEIVLSSALSTCGSTLAANSDCTLAASVRPQSTGNMTVTASLTADGTSALAFTSAPVAAPAYKHQVTFINQCPFPVWYGVANDNTTTKVDPTSPAGPDDYLLSAQIAGVRPATKMLTFSGDYLGGFWARTDCTTVEGQLVCQTANCTTQSPPNGGKCVLGQEPLPPFSRLEMNFFQFPQSDGSFDGVYDLTLIEGFNIPMEMKGFGPTATIIPPPPYNNSAFQCNTTGSPVQSPSTGLGNCLWNYAIPGAAPNRMPAKMFQFVTNEASPASFDPNTNDNCGCPAETLCGYAAGTLPADKNKFIPACGKFLGYWTINSLCNSVFNTTGYPNADPITHFQCLNNLNAQFGYTNKYQSSSTVQSLYSCIFNGAFPQYLNSCYLDPAAPGYNNSCCGAKNWTITVQDKFATITNPDWLNPGSSLVPSPYNSILWVKNACPTAYSYPFDDHSVSFYCKKSSPGVNVKMDYQVVFCPGGLTGKPS